MQWNYTLGMFCRTDEYTKYEWLFKYDIILASIEEILHEHYNITDKYIYHTILSFFSTKNIDIQIEHANVVPPFDKHPISLSAFSMNTNKQIFTISSKFPKSWASRKVLFFAAHNYHVHLSNNHIWISYQEEQDLDSEFQIANQDVYAEFKTHYLLHAYITCNTKPTRVTRVSYRRKAECPLEFSKWDIYYGKKELVTSSDVNSNEYDTRPHIDLRNYKSQLYFAGDKCLLFSSKYIYKLRENSFENTKIDMICEWNHPHFLGNNSP
eukprot:253968_1